MIRESKFVKGKSMKEKSMKDIMLIMSDQHGGAYTGMEDDRVRTPALMRIALTHVLFKRKASV